MVACLGATSPLPAAPPVHRPAVEGRCRAPILIELGADWARPRTTFQGWGTSLAWFASTTGNWPDPVRSRIADLLYGADGLGWTIARYNIGGGRKPGSPPLARANANVPGLWRMPAGATGTDWWHPDNPAMWDWSADSGQQWWLEAVKARVPAATLLLEASSYSPPWFMTVSGDVAGAAKPYQPNLRPGQEALFAEYLVGAMQGLERRHGVRFHSIAPLNEPNTPYWVSGNRQEGNYFSPEGQARMLEATDRVLRAHRSGAILSAMDETNHDTFVKDWSRYSEGAKAVVRQLNVHSYSTTGATGPRDVAAVTGLPLWMSEVDLSAPNSVQDFDNVSSALALGEQLVLDFKRLEPAGWVFWQAVEPSAVGEDKGSNWGLLRADMSQAHPADTSVHITSKYWAMATFSHAIRPGFRLVRNDDPDTITALSADGREAVAVHVNHGPYDRLLPFSTASLPKGRWTVASVTRDGRLVGQAPCAAGSSVPTAIAAPRAITAVRLRRD
ncbi:glycosyl hydrolase [Sphingomonas sp. AP4-R1]|nr:glycosyl hydrolase [Sphingomonas sp. AP4-R1]